MLLLPGAMVGAFLPSEIVWQRGRRGEKRRRGEEGQRSSSQKALIWCQGVCRMESPEEAWGNGNDCGRVTTRSRHPYGVGLDDW